MLWVAPVSPALELVLAVDFHVGYDHRQHLFMYVDSGYPISHRFPPGGSGERAKSSLTRVTGYRRSHRRKGDAQLFAQYAHSGSDRIYSLNFATESSISPLRASPILNCQRSKLPTLPIRRSKPLCAKSRRGKFKAILSSWSASIHAARFPRR